MPETIHEKRRRYNRAGEGECPPEPRWISGGFSLILVLWAEVDSAVLLGGCMRRSYLGMGFLSLIAGLLMLFSPEAWTKVVVMLLGIAAIVNGLFNLLYVRRVYDDAYFRRSIVIRGLLSVVVGLVAVILPLALAAAVWTVMVYVLAAYLLVSALLELFATIRLRSSGVDTRPYYGEIVGSIILAVVLFVIPAQVGVLLVRIFGGLLVLSGVGLFVWQWRNRGVEYYVHRKMTD